MKRKRLVSINNYVSTVMDKNSVNVADMPLRWGHFRVLIVASLGQAIGQGLALSWASSSP